MVPHSTLETPSAVEYPDSDGEPMADNTLQYRWIETIVGSLCAMYRDDPNVFVAGDLLWYPVEGDKLIRQAPDAMVAFSRPKGDRGSYRQWVEGGVASQVVFEILSPKNTPSMMRVKREFYDRYGVEEYYVYDPDRVRLEVWQRQAGHLQRIPQSHGWVSHKLGIRFDMSGPELVIYTPEGVPFRTHEEETARADQVAARAEQESARAEQEAARADEATARADEATARADVERRARRDAETRLKQLEERLRALGEQP